MSKNTKGEWKKTVVQKMVVDTVLKTSKILQEERQLKRFGWIVTAQTRGLMVSMRMENGFIDRRQVSNIDFGLENLGGVSMKTGNQISTFVKKRDENGFSYMEKI